MMQFKYLFGVLPAFILGLAACDEGSSSNAECTDNGHCAEMQICQDEVCVDVECLDSSQCDIHQYCNTQPGKYVCTAGCEADDDCQAGESCNVGTHECATYGCRTTTLDCPAGYVCNQGTGECELYDAGLCKDTCDIGATQDGCDNLSTCESVQYVEGCSRDQDCETGWHCDMYLTSDTFCWTANDCPDGSTCQAFQCVANYCHLDYCLPKCEFGEEDTCPASFSCAQVQGGQDFCWGDCAYLTENGYL